MTRDAAITAERFEEILAWLNADREIAGAMYVQLREDLAKVFAWRGCSDPEELTDEVFDRVATKVHQISDSYIGDPRFYFYGVAKNLIKENVKKSNTHISLKDVNDLSQPEIHEDELEEQKSLREKLFNECLKELSPTDRQLVLTYYQRDKRDAEKLAAQLGISQVNLRVRIHRIRQSLRRKLIRKMETNYQAK